MAEIFNFYVQDNRTIQFPKNDLLEPIMQEDHNVAVWRFRIPKVLNSIDMSGYAWWFVYVNAKNEKFSELLTLVDDIDEPDSFCTADYSIDYGISYHPGNFQFSLEAINADTGGEVLNEWHTKTYAHKVDKTLQGNQAQWAETESDIISALIVEVQNKVRQLVGGATPKPVSLIADMTDTKKVYLYVGEESGESTNYWYYYNGSAWVAGGLYASGITVDSTPTQGSNNAVRSGGVWDEITGLKSGLNSTKNTIIDEDNLPIPLSWTAGNLNTSTGAEESGTRQRSDYVSLKQDNFNISFSSPITDCIVFWYDENKEYKSRTGWLTNGATVTNANVYFRIMARKAGSNQLTADEIKSFTAVTAPIWKVEIEEVNTRVDSFKPLLSAFTIDDQIFTIDGYYINTEGNLRKYSTTSSIHYWATDFTDVSFCKQVKVHTCLGTGSTIAVYNGAKQMTRVITTQGSSALYDYDITLQNGEKYIRSSFQELTGYTTKDQFYLIEYKNILLAFDSLSENSGESNNAVERAQLKPLPMPTVVFIDDDGSSSLWDTTVPIFETAGVPLTIAVGKDSDIMSDLSTLRTWLATAGHDMVQHSLGTDQDLSAKTYTELISWIESEQAFFYNNGFVVSNIVYGGSQWSEQMLRVIERYYNCGCTIPNSQMGISYGYNLPGTSRYKLARYAVSNWTSTSGHSLQNCKDIFDEFIATGQNGIIIFYSHSYQLVDNPDRVQILTDFIDYVKTAQTNGDCAITTLSAVFG